MSGLGLRVQYRLGAEAVWYRDLPDAEARLREFRVPDDERYWGWGYVRRDRREHEEPRRAWWVGVGRTLAGAGAAADAWVQCQPSAASGPRGSSAPEGVLPSLGDPDVPRYEIVSRDCSNLLAGVSRAQELVREGHGDVLVTTWEKVRAERDRLLSYAILSDFSVALLVSSKTDGCPFELLDSVVVEDAVPSGTQEASSFGVADRACTEALLRRHGIDARGISRYFGLNFFRPLARMKARIMGLPPEGVYDGSTYHVSHCFGADPFINMARYADDPGPGPWPRDRGDELFLLSASGDGAAVAALVRPVD